MDRREAALWQIRQARRDLLLQIVAATVAVILSSVLLIAAARADVYINTPGGDITIGTFIPFGPAKIMHVPEPTSQADRDETEAREREWLKVCAPTFRRDKLGVMHYVFKKPGCEYGSPE